MGSGHLPPSAVIAQDALAQLSGAPVLSRACVAGLGDVAALRAWGVTHVVVCWYGSRRFVDDAKRPTPGTAAEYERRRAFNRDLTAQARSLWHRELRQPYPLRPGLELFALDGPW